LTAEPPPLVSVGFTIELPAEPLVSLRTAFLFLARFFCEPVRFFHFMARLFTLNKSPLSASPSMDSSPEPLGHFGYFSTKAENTAAEPSNAERI
jgi:hypothetical protein